MGSSVRIVRAGCVFLCFFVCVFLSFLHLFVCLFHELHQVKKQKGWGGGTKVGRRGQDMDCRGGMGPLGAHRHTLAVHTLESHSTTHQWKHILSEHRKANGTFPRH